MDRATRISMVVALAVCVGGCAAPAPTAPANAVSPSNAAVVSPSGLPSAVPSSAGGPVLDIAVGIAYARPATWTSWRPNLHDPIYGGPLSYLSTDPLLLACAVPPAASPNPPDAHGMACDWPLAALSPNGVFIDWYTTRILQRQPSAGEVIELNGRSARLQIEHPGSCATIGADESMRALVPMGRATPVTNIGVVACLRGPDLATSEMQVRAMLASATEVP